jgi:prepilin-type N-terminal cleavage/methylation domain-containing protein
VLDNELDKTKMTYNRKNAGFTLIELMIVVAIIAIIASVAIPRLMAARLSANESAAISTLRSLSSAQAQLQSSGAIDCDSDGGGEYGFFAELAGTAPLRISNGAAPWASAMGVVGTDELVPSVLSAAFGNVVAGPGGAGMVNRSGYNFQVFLPTGPAAPVGGISEGSVAPFGMGAAGDVDPNSAEVLWCAYAWPTTQNQTGNRCFFVNQEGDLMQYNNRGATTYSALVGPTFDAAYTIAADMSSPIAIGAAGIDGNTWVPVQ